MTGTRPYARFAYSHNRLTMNRIPYSFLRFAYSTRRVMSTSISRFSGGQCVRVVVSRPMGGGLWGAAVLAVWAVGRVCCRWRGGGVLGGGVSISPVLVGCMREALWRRGVWVMMRRAAARRRTKTCACDTGGGAKWYAYLFAFFSRVSMLQ